MSIEKPWEKEFDDLLQKFRAYWGGEVKAPDDLIGRNSYKGLGFGFFTYPGYKKEHKDYTLLIDISESPIGDISVFEGGDNVEYLRLYLLKPTDYNMLIRKEGFFDKVHKLLGLAFEFKTGNPEFDKKYFIRAKTDHGKSLLKRQDFQDMIKNVEPFAGVRINASGLHWSQEIRNKSQLEFDYVKKYIDWLANLLKIITKEKQE
jgi:hypothetical protein